MEPEEGQVSKRAPHPEIGGACRLRPRRISNDAAAIEAFAGTARSFSCGSCLVCLNMDNSWPYRKFQARLDSPCEAKTHRGRGRGQPLGRRVGT